MDLDDQLDSGLNGIEVIDDAKKYLSELIKWIQLLIVIMIIFAIIILICLAFLLLSPYRTPYMILVYLGMLTVSVLPTIFMYRFTDHTKLAMKHSDSYQLALAIKNLKSLFKFVGISIILYIVFIFGGILVGVLTSGTFS